MEIRRIICKSGNIYSIVNESWSNSTGWGHKSTLIRENTNSEIETAKIRYYNRTWETYAYQSCMNKLINIILENEQNYFIEVEKANKGIIRLTQKTKDEILNKWEEMTFIKDLREIKERISNRNFD